MSINSNSKSSEKLENILIIGNGGRENALAWVIEKNEQIKNIYLLPGNAGSTKIHKAKNINLDLNNTDELVNNLKHLNIDLVVIGPETPLANGLGDFLRENNFNVFGPGRDGAKLESSKSWAKQFMLDANIPTANFWKVNTFEKAKEIILSSNNPLVVKADGLASGKGVFIAETKEESLQASAEILKGKFGAAGQSIVLEEKIEGPEVSVFALCDGNKFVLLPTAQDHKRIYEGDKGPNTGGMGAYSPTPIITQNCLNKIINKIIQPTIDELKRKNIEYRGVLYFGLMITKSGPKVIEYNCRFGDPECQTLMPLMDKDFVSLLHKCAMGNLLINDKINNSNKVSGCVIATSKGYPLEYKTGFPIKIGNIDTKDLQIFDSGTSLGNNSETLTNGGRVLSIVCQGDSFDEVFEKIYKNLKEINFEGMFYRKDIGYQVRSNKNLEN